MPPIFLVLCFINQKLLQQKMIEYGRYLSYAYLLVMSAGITTFWSCPLPFRTVNFFEDILCNSWNWLQTMAHWNTWLWINTCILITFCEFHVILIITINESNLDKYILALNKWSVEKTKKVEIMFFSYKIACWCKLEITYVHVLGLDLQITWQTSPFQNRSFNRNVILSFL